jgi:hypothetical protein
MAPGEERFPEDVEPLGGREETKGAGVATLTLFGRLSSKVFPNP